MSNTLRKVVEICECNFSPEHKEYMLGSRGYSENILREFNVGSFSTDDVMRSCNTIALNKERLIYPSNFRSYPSIPIFITLSTGHGHRYIQSTIPMASPMSP